MRKAGIVYRYLLEKKLEDKKAHFKIREIARILELSPNTVSLAVAALVRSGAAVVYRGHFEIVNPAKTLMFWTVGRRLEKDVVYSTYVKIQDVSEIEKYMPSKIAYTCYSGYVNIFGNDASDYGNVYVYASGGALDEIRNRFHKNDRSLRVKGHNLFVLKPDAVLEKQIEEDGLKHSSVGILQLYVDLWNMRDWWAYDFLKKLKNKMVGMYGESILE